MITVGMNLILSTTLASVFMPNFNMLSASHQQKNADRVFHLFETPPNAMFNGSNLE
jgi:hypothetical protein